MEIYEILLKLAAGATALTTIIIFIKKIVKKIKNCIDFFADLKAGITRLEAEQSKCKSGLSELTAKVAKIEEHTTENYMNVLRTIIMSEEMPLGERLQAGEKYVNNNGNGEIKQKYNVLKKEYEERERMKNNVS